MRRVITILALLTLALPGLATLTPQQEVSNHLQDEVAWGNGNHHMKQPHPEDLRHLGPQVFPLLAAHVRNSQEAFFAAADMLTLDPDVAAPFLFAAMPDVDLGAWQETFTCLVSHVLEGNPKFPVWEMHNAAIRCLKTGKATNDAQVAIITAIGLTGNQADFLLLRPYLHSPDATQAAPDVWRTQYRYAAEASLARLGDE